MWIHTFCSCLCFLHIDLKWVYNLSGAMISAVDARVVRSRRKGAWSQSVSGRSEGPQLVTLHALTRSTRVLCILLSQIRKGTYFRAVFPCLVIVSQPRVVDLCCVWCFWGNCEDYRSAPVSRNQRFVWVSRPGWPYRARTTLHHGGPTGCTISRILILISRLLIKLFNQRTPAISRWELFGFVCSLWRGDRGKTKSKWYHFFLI